MKYTLDNFFETLTPNELDEIMPDGFDAKLPKKALKRVENNVLQKAGFQKNKRRFNLRILAPAAACLAVTAGLGGYAIAAEAKEYSAAVEFFAENGLSSEGLSRGELKAVYRDITTNRFTNGKTAEVIARSVPGVEIFQNEPTPEELAALWNSNAQNVPLPRDTVEYTVEYPKKPHPLGFDVIDRSVVECRRDGKTLWTAEFPELYISAEDCVLTSSGTAVWGHTDTWSSEMPVYAHIARIDDSGNKLWERRLDHGFTHEYIRAVLENDDGTWAVISRGDFEYLCLSRFDMDGNELSFKKTEVGNNGIWNAVRLGDGYLVQLGNTAHGNTAHLVKLDRDGGVTDNFVYESDDCDYYITDMMEFEGNVYLSAYSVPKQTDEGGRHEIADILDYVFSKDDVSSNVFPEVSSEELTPIVRENYTAVLLLCDPDGGEPKNFYSVKGSLGGALAVEDGQLKWNAESVISSSFSPYTNSFTIAGSCKVYRYSFDGTGALAECEETGETTRFAR